MDQVVPLSVFFSRSANQAFTIGTTPEAGHTASPGRAHHRSRRRLDRSRGWHRWGGADGLLALFSCLRKQLDVLQRNDLLRDPVNPNGVIAEWSRRSTGGDVEVHSSVLVHMDGGDKEPAGGANDILSIHTLLLLADVQVSEASAPSTVLIQPPTGTRVTAVNAHGGRLSQTSSEWKHGAGCRVYSRGSEAIRKPQYA